MRNRILLFFVVSLLGLSFTIVDWEIFKSYDGKFQVLAPGEMIKKVNPIETEIGEMKYVTFLHQSENKNADNLVYMVSYCDYPENSIHSDSTELVNEFFETTVSTAVESVNGELQYSTEINIGNYPGRLWRINYNEGHALIKTKSFLVGRRYYSIQAITMKDRSMNLSMDKFLDSFSLLSDEERLSKRD